MLQQNPRYLHYKTSRSSSQTKVSSFCRSLSPRSKKIQNPELADLQNYTPPRKAPIKNAKNVLFKESRSLKRQQNIKSTLKVTETTSSSHFLCYALMIWLVLFLLIIGVSIYSKVQQNWQLASLNKNECKQDFMKNRCEKPFKDLIKFCQQKQLCMNSQVEDLFIKDLKISHILGSVLNEFIDGAGLWVTAIGIIILTIGIIFGKTRSVTKEFTQYY